MTAIQSRFNSRAFGLLLLLLLALMLPFEVDRPLLVIGPLVATNLELVLGLIFLVTGLVWWQERPFWPQPHRSWLLLLIAGGLFLGTAVLAPEQNVNAVKAALRLLSGIALALAVPFLVRDSRQRLSLLLAIIISSLIVAVIGLAEIWLGRELGWLLPFRTNITTIGGYFRLTGPLDYTNQTAMYIEATTPLLMMAGWLWWRRTGKTAVLLLNLLLLLLLLQASFQTLSRASLVTIGIVGLTMALLVGWRQKAVALPWLALVGLMGMVFLFNFISSDVFRLRFASEGENSWYIAHWQVPPTLTMKANEVQPVPITVTNNGTLIWSNTRRPPINLGARWIENEGGLQLSEPRWPFVQPVLPRCKTVSLEIPLTGSRCSQACIHAVLGCGA